jgi:molybdopterin synthase catalytic subunit
MVNDNTAASSRLRRGAHEVQVRGEGFDPLEMVRGWLLQPRDQPPEGGPTSPAAAEFHFIGRVRGVTTGGAPLDSLELEHYPGMTEERILAIAAEAAARHGAEAVLVVHRVGRIPPGEAIVLVAVTADRRGSCQRCGEEVLENLKHHAPFWKREWSGGQGAWLAGNTPR